MSVEFPYEASQALEELVERMQQAERDCDLMASETIYRGNSVSWWHSKAIAYRDALDEAWDALREAGIRPDGHSKTVALGIKELAARVGENAS